MVGGCPFCACPHTRPLTPSPLGGVMHRCGRCASVFRLPLWIANEAAGLAVQGSIARAGEIAHGDRQAALRQAARRIHTTVRGAAGSPPRLLDIGCADGSFFDALRAEGGAGWELHGIEPDAAWMGHEYGGARVIHVPLNGADYAPEAFAAITANDVLYLLPNLVESVRQIRGWLRPGAVFLFDVPGIAYLRLRAAVGGVGGWRRTRLFQAYPYYPTMRGVDHLLRGAGFTRWEVYPEVGIRHPKTALRLVLNSYTALAHLPRMVRLAPKVVILAYVGG